MRDTQDIKAEPLAGAVAARHARVDASHWRACCEDFAARGGRLVALWGSDAGGTYEMHAVLADAADLIVLTLPLAGTAYPDLSELFPAASRMQRAAQDLLGLVAEGAADTRKWLRHAAWPAERFPLRKSRSENASQDHDYK